MTMTAPTQDARLVEIWDRIERSLSQPLDDYVHGCLVAAQVELRALMTERRSMRTVLAEPARVTVDQIAEIAGVHAATIRRRLAGDADAPAPVGSGRYGVYLYDQVLVRAWLDHRRPATSLDLAEAAELVDVGERTIKRWLGTGEFPPPDGTDDNAHWWQQATVTAWAAQRTQRTDGLLNIGDVARLAGVVNQTVETWLRKHDDFPQPFKLVGDRRRWWEPDPIRQWIARRNEQRQPVEVAKSPEPAAARKTTTHTALAILCERLDAGDTYVAAGVVAGFSEKWAKRHARRLGLRSSAATGRHEQMSLAHVETALRAAVTAHDGTLSTDDYLAWRNLHPDAPSPATLKRRLAPGVETWAAALAAVGGNAPVTDLGRRGAKRWSNEQIIEAIATSRAATIAEYDTWRRNQANPQPSPATAAQRFGSWPAARDAAHERSSAGSR